MFVIDWLTFTSKIDSIQSILTALGLSKHEFKVMPKGRHGYKESVMFENIWIYFNPFRDDMGVCVDMSGTGCRAFETFSDISFDTVFRMILDDTDIYNITRLDVAFDDKEGIIPLNRVADDIRFENKVSRWTEWSVRYTSKGLTCEVGSSLSDSMITVYDKALERGFKGDDYFHWVRCELLLRDERALEFINQYMNEYHENLGELWSGVIYNYLRFVIPNKNDDNKSRWRMRPYWAKLLKSAEKVRLFVAPGMEYNEGNLHNYVFKQSVGAIKTAIQLMGNEKFLEEVENAKVKLNPKYEVLIERNKRKETFDFEVDVFKDV